MTHAPETTLEDAVAQWYREYAATSDTETTVYQSGVWWFVDIVVDRADVTLFIETENDISSVRDGVAQSEGYAGRDLIKGIPMVVFPAGHADEEKDQQRIEQLRIGSNALIREFDEQAGEWV